MKANNQDEKLMKDVLLTTFIVTILIVILITLTLYTINTPTSLASSLYVAAILISLVFIFYLDRKVTINGGGGKGK